VHAPPIGAPQPERAAYGAPARVARSHDTLRSERGASPPSGLPGEPANRVYRPRETAAPASISSDGERAVRAQSNARSHGGHERQVAQPESAGEAGTNARGWSGRR